MILSQIGSITFFLLFEKISNSVSSASGSTITKDDYFFSSLTRSDESSSFSAANMYLLDFIMEIISVSPSISFLALSKAIYYLLLRQQTRLLGSQSMHKYLMFSHFVSSIKTSSSSLLSILYKCFAM